MTTPDRDRSVEQWLRQTPIPGAPPELCLDADTLAAWSDGTLDVPSRAAAEAHAASCGRCQAMLAAMIRTVPAAAAAPSPWSPRRWMMMLAPAAAAAAAVALWVAVGRPTEQSVLPTAAPAPAAAAAEPVPPSAAPVVTPPLEKDQAAPSRDVRAPLDAAEPKRLADAGSERESRVRGEKKEVGASSQFRRDERAANERAFALPSPPPPPAAPATAPPPAAVAETVAQAAASPPIQGQRAPAAPQQTTQALTQQQAGARQQQAAEPSAQQAQQQIAVAAERAAAAGAAGGAGGGIVSGRLAADAADSLRARKVAMVAEAVAPSASARWRVLDGRVVQRSSDAGATWADQFTANAGVELIVGSAPSATTCWFVGRAGVVVRTADGRAWTTVKFPEQIDLVSVTATDAQSASVAAVDGRVFVTTDGGGTWRRR